MPSLSRRHVLLALAGGSFAVSAPLASPSPEEADALSSPGLTATVPVALGAWTQGMDADPALLERTAGTLGRAVSIASIFRGKGDDPYWPYPADRTLATGRTLLVAWSLEDYGPYSWWLSGSGDTVLRDKARTLKAFGRPVVLRPWAEMNADWVAHQPTTGTPRPSGGTPTEFVAAWRHVVAVFRQEGATNVRWAFNPTTDTYAGTTDVRTIYPGDDVVDVLGLDGYNWGTTAPPNHGWRSFDDIYATQYARLVALAPHKPVWLCEISSADPASPGTSGVTVTAPAGQSKSTWWQDAFAHLRFGYGHVQAVVFFDADKERDWRISSSPSAAPGLRAAVAQPIRKPLLG